MHGRLAQQKTLAQIAGRAHNIEANKHSDLCSQAKTLKIAINERLWIGRAHCKTLSYNNRLMSVCCKI